MDDEGELRGSAEPRLHRAKHDNASPTLGGDNAHATYDEDPANASAMVAHGCRRPNGDDQRFRRCAGQVVGPGEYRNDYGSLADPWDRVLERLREIGAATLVEETGFSRSAVYAVLGGARPHPANQAIYEMSRG